MTFSTIAELRAYIIATFTANGVRDITGPEAQDAFIGILDLISPALLTQLDVSVEAGKVGGAKNGDSLTVGTTLEAVLRKILREAVPPVYVLPTSVLNTNVATLDQEIGTVISPTLGLLFTQHDGGVMATAYLTKNGSNIATSFPYTDSSVTLAAAVAYQGFATYAQGVCKNDSLGNSNCSGRVQPGIAASNIITYNPYRKAFFGTPVAVVTSSATVRSLSNGFLNPVVGSQFVINIPAGSQRVVFAIPASLGSTVSSIKYREFGNCEVKAVFDSAIVSVEGAAGYTAINYRVFTFEPIESFQVAATYEVTI
jgi:hypothetical protein